MYVEDPETQTMVPQVIAELLFHNESIQATEYFVQNGEKIAIRAIGIKYGMDGQKITEVSSPWFLLK